MIRPLMQERYADDPWKLLVGCMLLNRAHGRVAIPAAEVLFKRFRTAEQLACAEPAVVESILRGLGFQRRRARYVIEFSREWLDPARREALELTGKVYGFTGCGRYAQESYDLFVRGLDIRPVDRVLATYVEEADDRMAELREAER